MPDYGVPTPPVRPEIFRQMNIAWLTSTPPGFLLAKAGGSDGSGWIMWVPLIAMIPFWYMLLIRPQQKERAKRQELINSLKKNDRVVTTSGMIGTVANVSQDGKEITLKFGDATRIPFLRSAIEAVLRDGPDAAEPATKT